ncbi:MAG: deoxynucleoside kinase, partial [Flavobacteriales bacterium]|nr:deoxynucleoside kinase [Flavobacteriales bacterium]
VKQISERGREYENSISIEYLKRLNERYDAWIEKYDKGKLLVIDVEDNSFHNDPEDLGKIISRIDAEIHGLFPMEPATKVPVRTIQVKAGVKSGKAKGGKVAAKPVKMSSSRTSGKAAVKAAPKKKAKAPAAKKVVAKKAGKKR